MVDYHAHVSAKAAANIDKWLTEPKYVEYKPELEAMIANEEWQELEDSFFKVIEFGTAGRRGVTGPGANRINRVTIGESTQALVEYALSFDKDASKKGVVIAYDTRLTSPELSRYAAQVAAGNGFKVYLFEDFRSTPELSFAVRYLQAAVGIVISASHNPPSDNGFKAYWNDGAQIAAPHDKGVLDKANSIEEIKAADFDHAVNSGIINYIGSEVDKAYIEAVCKQSEGNERDVSIVYSPLHGAGQTNVLPALREAGFKDIRVVEAQMTPDGNFPTVKDFKPNPQERAANDMAVELLLSSNADIAITNDPDADRLGVVVRHGDTPIYLSGNQAYILAADYALSKLEERNQLTAHHYIANTFVTTDMSMALAKRYGVHLYNSLPVGFKYFGQLLREKEATDEVFIIGGEESYGALKGDYARDKDGASAALPLAEYAAELKKQQKTLYHRLLELYGEHGLYLENMENVDFPGANGFATMQRLMQSLRTSPPASIGEHRVTAVRDYSTLERRDLQTGEITSIDSVANNTIAFELGQYERRMTIRPSGTEPKMKVYGMWYESYQGGEIETQYIQAKDKLAKLSTELADLLLS